MFHLAQFSAIAKIRHELRAVLKQVENSVMLFFILAHIMDKVPLNYTETYQPRRPQHNPVAGLISALSHKDVIHQGGRKGMGRQTISWIWYPTEIGMDTDPGWARVYDSLSVTPASSKVSISRNIRTAPSMIPMASAPPVPSPRRIPRSRIGLSPRYRRMIV